MEKTEWHPAFCAAMRLELRDNETAEYYTCLYLLSDTRSGFLCACRLIARKGFITVWEQCHGTVSYASKVYQTLNALPAPYTVFPKRPKCLAFVVRYFNVPARRVTGDREGLFVFFPIAADGFIFTPAKIQKDAFWVFGAEKKPPAAIPALGKRDNSINYPFSP